MWLDYVDWFLTLLMLLLNLWLASSIYRSEEASKIYLFLFMYFLIFHDCLNYIITLCHDIPSYYVHVSIFKNIAILTNITVTIQSCQWFFHLFFLPVFSLLHFFALFFPMHFRRFDIRSTVAIIVLLYGLTAAVTIPLFTVCCGYIYYVEGSYWFFDYNKPYSKLYQIGNNYLQGVCIVFMVSITVAIVTKLSLLRKKLLMTSRTSVLAVSSSHRIETDVTAASGGSSTRRTTRVILTPEVRLAVSFVLLSGCWLASTLAFNLLMGTQNPFMSIVSLIASYLNRGKWIVYCLGNRNIRKIFNSPSKLCA